MLNAETKRHIDSARQVLVGKIPDPKSQIEQITNALIYKFMDDMDARAIAHGGQPTFFTENLEEYSWSRLMDRSFGSQERMNKYDEALRKFGTAKQLPPLFRTIFKEALLPFKSPETLNLFLNEIAYFNYKNSEELGNAFEYLLSTLGTQGDAGQFRTPRHIIDFVVNVLDPKKTDTILDPACGTAGFLISAFKHIAESHDGVDKDGKSNDEKRLTPIERKKIMENITGYDISPDMVRLSLVNMYLHGYQYGLQNPNIIEYDTLSQTDRWDDKFDVMLANPPFMTPKGGIIPHKKFEISANRAEVLFVDYIKTHLKPNGRAGIIVPEGVIFQSSGAYKELRKLLVEDGLYGVVSLPNGVFNPYSGVKTSILLFDNSISKKTSKMLFIKIDHDGYDLGAQRRDSKKNDLPNALTLLKNYKLDPSKEFEDSTFAWVVDKSLILSTNDISLTGERYKIAKQVVKENWDLYKIEDVCDLGRGRVINKQYIEENTGEYPVYSSQTENNGEFGKINTYDFDGEYVTWTTDGANAGTVFYRNGKFNCTNVCGTLKLKKEKEGIISMKYLALVLNQVSHHYVIKVGNPKLMNNVVAKIEIPVPSFPTQESIVSEIYSKQEIINSAKSLIDKIDNERSSSGDLFKQLDVKTVQLGQKDIFEIISGGTPDSSNETYWNGEVNWVTLADLPQGNLVTEIFSSERKITEAGLKNSSAKLLPPNSILVSTRASIGRVAISRTQLATNQGFKNIIVKDTAIFNPKFVAYFMTTLTDRMKSLASGGTFKEISKTSFETLDIPLLEMNKQNDIVHRFEQQIEAISANRRLIRLFEDQIKDIVDQIFEI